METLTRVRPNSPNWFEIGLMTIYLIFSIVPFSEIAKRAISLHPSAQSSWR